MYQPYVLLAILTVTFILFIWGYWRYDVVAFFALILSILTGIVPFNLAFTGFSNPAVITVACVMVLTSAISQSGILDYVITRVEFLFSKMWLHIASLTVISAILSAFMNNVGALGLMMPIAIQTSIKNKQSPSLILMPIAFGSVLGGLTTAIGTPPNLLISHFRQELVGQSFSMFDFTPVGILVALAGVIFIAFIGWRFLPPRQKISDTGDLFQISDYITELKSTDATPYIGKTIKEMLNSLKEIDFELIAIIQKKTKKFNYSPDELIRKSDIFIVEASHDSLDKLIEQGKFQLSGEKPFSTKGLSPSDIDIMEAVTPPGSDAVGRSAKSMKLRQRYSVNLLALSREGTSFRKKLNEIRFVGGDIVLLQGNAESLRENIVSLGFIPLAERQIKIGLSQKSILPFLIMLVSILLAAFNVLPIDIAFAAGVLALMVFNVVPIRSMHKAIDWSVLLLLGAIIPVGQSIQSTGAADLISNGFMQLAGQFSPMIVLAAILILTMTLSDIMNNAATAVVMAPIAIQIANSMQVNVDSFLMAVAIGASCSFLTPIAHQNNTMILGPGAYKFFDYSRLGLPLEIIVLAVAIPSIMYFWPL